MDLFIAYFRAKIKPKLELAIVEWVTEPSIRFYTEYFDVALNGSDPSWLRAYKALLLIGTIYELFLFRYQDTLSDYQNTLLFNEVYFEQLDRVWNLGLAALLFGHYIMLSWMCSSNDGVTARTFHELIVLGENSQMFRWYRNPEEIREKRLLNPQYVPWTMAQTVKWWAVGLHSLVFALWLCFATSYYLRCEYKVLGLFVSSGRLFSVSGLLEMTQFQVSGLLLTGVHLAMGHTIAIVLTNTALLMLVPYIGLNRAENWVRTLDPVRVPAWLVFRFLQQGVHELRYQADASRLYGRMLFAWLLVGLPLNVFTLTVLVDMRQFLTFRLKLVAFASLVIEFLILFGAHLYGAWASRKLARPAKRMMVVAMENHELAQTRQGRLVKLKLVRYVEQVHNMDNPYTMHYGKYGKITFYSFGRQIFYYCKLLMFAYKAVSH